MSFTPEKSVVLIGLMGAGKSSVGRRLAASLNLPFSDIDHIVEKQAGMSISRIFASEGEDKFREMELDTIKETLDEPVHIIATGGGAFMRGEVRDIIRQKAISVWLKAPLDILVERVSRKNTRPLLENGNKQEIMAELIKQRYPVYEQADLTVESSTAPHHVVVNEIINQLKYLF